MINSVTDPQMENMLNMMPGAWGCKDINSVFLCANTDYKKIVGLLEHEEVAGLNDYDLPALTVVCARLFREQDQKIIHTRRPIKVIDIYTFDDGSWKAYLFTKSPIVINDKVTGIIFHGQEVTDVIALELGGLLSSSFVKEKKVHSIDKNYFNNQSKNNLHKLTTRESEVIFYLLRGGTVKQIAIWLNISSRTVEDYLRQLKTKFNAKNKHELIAKGMNRGYLNIIPQRFLQTQLLLEMG